MPDVTARIFANLNIQTHTCGSFTLRNTNGLFCEICENCPFFGMLPCATQTLYTVGWSCVDNWNPRIKKQKSELIQTTFKFIIWDNMKYF